MAKDPYSPSQFKRFFSLLQLVIFDEKTDSIRVDCEFPFGYVFVPVLNTYTWTEQRKENRRTITFTLKPIFIESKKAWLLRQEFTSKSGNLVEHNKILDFDVGEKLFKEHFGEKVTNN